MGRVQDLNATISYSDIARQIRFQQHPTLTACWVWTGYTDARGYAYAFFDNRQVSARQAVYARLKGGSVVTNLKPICGASLCVNPHHMKGLS